MAKINTPAPKAQKTDAETIAAPAVDMAPLIQSLAGATEKIRNGDAMKDEGILDAVIEIRSFREANENVERDQIRSAVQTVIAEAYGLKLEQVAKKPDETLKEKKPADYAQRNSCYTLVSQLLAVAWAKSDKNDEKVAKALEKGESRFTVLVKTASQKPGTAAKAEIDRSITKENFSAKFTTFLEKFKADGQIATIEEVYETVDKYLEAARSAPKE